MKLDSNTQSKLSQIGTSRTIKLNPPPIVEEFSQSGFPSDWLYQRIHQIIATDNSLAEPFFFDLETTFGNFVSERKLSNNESVVCLTALTASFSPELFSPLNNLISKEGKSSTIGGIIEKNGGCFFPTLRTAIYLIAGNDLEKRARLLIELHPKSKIFSLGIVKAEPTSRNGIFLDSQLVFNDQFLGTILIGDLPKLDGDPSFPVKRSHSVHTLKDVVLCEKTMAEIIKLQRFARNMQKLWSLKGSEKVRRNYLCVFTGAPGTGKSFAVDAVGNELELPVYKVNLAQLVSKYVGETEKNLEIVFNRFHMQPSILFFDEAESIFSKRTEVNDSHDQYANNLQSYLLQKIEEFEGIVVLATNVHDLTHYFDKAFQRRIRSIVNFEFPEYEERLAIWRNSLFDPYHFEEGVIEQVAKNYQLSGGSIYNVVSDAVIDVMDKDQEEISLEIIKLAMKDEFKKTGRILEVCNDEMVRVNPAKRFGIGFEKRRDF